jgi:hypothetical protein
MKRHTYPGLTGAVTDPNDEVFSFLDHFHTLVLATGAIQKRDLAVATDAIQTIKAALSGPHHWSRGEQEELCGALFDLLFAVNAAGQVAKGTAGSNATLQSAAHARLAKQEQSRRAGDIIFPIAKAEWLKNQKLRTAYGLAKKCLDPVQAALKAERQRGVKVPSIGLYALRDRIDGFLKVGLLDSRPTKKRTTEQSSNKSASTGL